VELRGARAASPAPVDFPGPLPHAFLLMGAARDSFFGFPFFARAFTR
jgi:hypothetical protein